MNEQDRVPDLFQVTLASIGDAVIATDVEGRVTFLNHVAEQLTGWPLAEARGQLLSDVFHIVQETSRQPVANPALRALELGTIVGLANHTILIARNGREVPIDDSAAPIRDGHGRVAGAVLVFRDITERKKAEETQAMLAAIVASSDDAIISKTLDGTITSWNAAAERLFGHPASEAIGQSITLIIPPERLPEETEIIGRIRRGERVDHFETVRMRNDGRRVDISITVSPVRDREGRIIGASKIARDIAARKHAEADLVESEGRHRALYTLAAAVQPLTDPEAIVATAARVLCEHLKADRCAYAEVEDGSVFHIPADYCRSPGVRSIAGDWPVSSFGTECARQLHADEAYVVADSEDDPRIDPDVRTAYQATQIRSGICVPLHKNGRLAAVLTVHQSSPRSWSEAEIKLVAAVAGRCWESIERARVATALRIAEERFSFVRQSSGVGFWYCDLPLDVLNWDERVKEHFHLPSDAVVTIGTFYERIHADDREPTRRAIERSIAERKPYDVHYRTVHPLTSEVKWIRAVGRTAYATDGTPLRFDGVTLDVSAQYRVEEELRDQNRILQTLQAIGARLSAELDISKLLQSFTDETTSLTGAAFGAFFYNASDINGGSYMLYTLSGAPKEAFAKFPYPRATAIFEPTFKGEGTVRLDDVTRDPRFGQNAPYHGHPPGHLPVRSYLAVPVKSRTGEVLGGLFFGHAQIGIFNDRHAALVEGVAAQAAVAIDNARLYERLRDADRRKDEFLATLAHELRNPLAPIRTGVQILKSGPVPQHAERTLDIMQRQSEHLTHLIDDLMDVARVTSGKIHLRVEALDLREVVRNAVEATRLAVETGAHALEIHMPGTPLTVSGDATRLVQVLTNLLTNAAKYTDRGGRITVEGRHEDGTAVVRVTDTGVGIAPEMLPKVFDMFAQVGAALHRSQGGIGIGLTLVRKLVEMHGGTVTAQSPGEDQGSTFTLRLPLVALPAPSREEPEAIHRSSPSLRVLVIDDNQDAATSLAMLLTLSNHDTRTAFSGPHGVEVALGFKPHLIFLDIGLPGMNGYDVARTLRLEPSLKDLRIVALTGWGSEEDRKKSQDAGCNEHLTKPVSLEDVRNVLANINSGSSPRK